MTRGSDIATGGGFDSVDIVLLVNTMVENISRIPSGVHIILSVKNIFLLVYTALVPLELSEI